MEALVEVELRVALPLCMHKAKCRNFPRTSESIEPNLASSTGRGHRSLPCRRDKYHDDSE